MDNLATTTNEAKDVISLPVFDLDAFDVLEKANQGVEFELKTEDGKPTNFFLRALGRDADVLRELAFAQQTKRMNAMSENNGKFQFNAEESDADALNFLATAVTSWSIGKSPWTGYVLRKGEKVLPTKDNVIDMLRRTPTFREQLDEFIGKRAHFMKG